MHKCQFGVPKREFATTASARKAIVDAKRTRINAVVPRLDTQSITDNPGTNNELDLQLEWHRRLDLDKRIPPKTKMTRKEDKVTALVAAVKRYNEGMVHAPKQRRMWKC
jgi:hypothetical protein